MKKNLRNAVIAGNWKMNKTPAEAKALIEEAKPLLEKADCGVIMCVPFVDLCTALEATKGTNIKIGAQNCHFEKSGAFTGEISAPMLKEMGVEYVILGHSERRTYFGDTDELVAMQVKIALGGLSAEQVKNVIIAYEPIWAIGTGLTATADQADEVCKIIRDTVAGLYGREIADGMTIQYGGSMNAKNAAELLSKENVDGGLIGGASLKAPDFAAIVEAASK